MARRPLRCPVCRGRAITIVEESRAFTTFQQSASGFIDKEGFHHHGSIVGLNATCDNRRCQHRWRPRAKQADLLAGWLP
jgi:hypothetical protein